MLIYSAASLCVAVILLALARNAGGFAEWYAQHIYPVFPHTLGRLLSPLPFSVFELLLWAVAIGLVLLLACAVALPFSPALRRRCKRRLPLLPAVLCCACSSLLLIFTLTCGVNYSRASVADYLGINARPSSAQELRQLFDILAEEADELSSLIVTDTSGYFCLQEQTLHQGSRAALQQLNRYYAGLISYYPQPKAVFFSQGMSWLGISGIYSPFTVEANYNRDMPDVNQPFSVCHELAHLSGFMREDEANFIGYLACLHSDNADFRYSGVFYALIYVLNALYTAIPREEYSQLYAALPAQLRRDMQQSAAYWQRFEGKVADFSENMNDAYLKANLQPDGVQSYGRMVDLLLAYYIAE